MGECFVNLINNAIEKNEVLNLLRGDKGYEIENSQFVSDVLPTDIGRVLINCFYKQVGRIDGIEKLFIENIYALLSGDAVDVYIAILYIRTCIFYEEKGSAPFIIEKEVLADKFREVLNSKKDDLQREVIFCNKMKKKNPWKNIENFNKYFYKNYGFGIIEE